MKSVKISTEPELLDVPPNERSRHWTADKASLSAYLRKNHEVHLPTCMKEGNSLKQKKLQSNPKEPSSLVVHQTLPSGLGELFPAASETPLAVCQELYINMYV